MNKAAAAADVVIFGGGIAGLWLLNRLRQRGFSALLFESGTLGGGQTVKAQGIIHGGMKYALQGVLTNDTKAVSTMPVVWRDCLTGKGEIDLSNVPILSHQHYLWSPSKLTSKLTGFLASTMLNGQVQALEKNDYPAVFKNPAFKGEIFSLDEMVIDIPVLIRELVKANQDAIFKIEPVCDEELKIDDTGNMVSATVYLSGKSIEIQAKRFVFTAGAGNEVIIKKLQQQKIAMQRRPLHMVLVKIPFDYPLYGHCLGLGNRPRITITTHRTQEGDIVWYLGGLLAEEGVERNTEEQIDAARSELKNLFPWLDFSTAEFATFMVDRAEPLQKNQAKPESFYVKVIQNIIVAWPTKLVLAPKLADDIVQELEKSKLSQHVFDIRELRSWPIPPLATPVWEDAFCKHVD